MELKPATAKVMFLHGLEGTPGVEKQKILQSILGPSKVCTPNLKIKEALTFFFIAGALAGIACTSFTIVCFVRISATTGILALLGMILTLLLLYWIVGRGVTHFMLKRSVAIAEKAFLEFRPNLLVTSSFGAVIALSMDIPKCPMILLSPAQDQYTRYMKLDKKFSIKGYPYVILVHGSLDKKVPLDDSVRLMETSEVGKCRLELLEDDHLLKTVTRDDMKVWVDEAFERGQQEVMNMAIEGSKHVDMMLFLGNEEENIALQ